MLDGWFEPAHLLVTLVFVAIVCGGLWLVVRIVRNAWKKS